MHHRSAFCALSLFVLGCGEAAAPPAGANVPAAVTETFTFARSPDSGTVDRIGATDGALAADDVKDLSFVVEVDGAVTAVFLATVDESGRANGGYQADTLVGETEVPKEVAVKWGKSTSGLGVVEGDKLLNAPDGSLPPLPAAHHRLVLYISPSSKAIAPGTRLRAWIQRPDRTVVAGATLTQP